MCQRWLLCHVSCLDPSLRLVGDAEPATALAIIGPASQVEPGIVARAVCNAIEVAWAVAYARRGYDVAGVTVGSLGWRCEAHSSTSKQQCGRSTRGQLGLNVHLLLQGLEVFENRLAIFSVIA